MFFCWFRLAEPTKIDCGLGGARGTNPHPHPRNHARTARNNGRTNRPNKAGRTDSRQTSNGNAEPTATQTERATRPPKRQATRRNKGRTREANKEQTAKSEAHNPQRAKEQTDKHERQKRRSKRPQTGRAPPTPGTRNETNEQHKEHPQKSLIAFWQFKNGITVLSYKSRGLLAVGDGGGRSRRGRNPTALNAQSRP